MLAEVEQRGLTEATAVVFVFESFNELNCSVVRVEISPIVGEPFDALGECLKAPGEELTLHFQLLLLS